MLYFLENHDEHRIASEPFAGNAKKGIPGLIVSVLLQQNPFMLYAGQEFGERGMDEEGFSGRDGRTTIFDYWTVSTINRGYFNRRNMKKDEKELEKVYSTILNIACKEKAVSNGATYDLMYANPELNSKVFVFLRKQDKELLVVAANFSDEAVKCSVNIPQHAFDFLSIADGVYESKDLLSSDKQVFTLKSNYALPIKIEPNNGRVYKIKL